MSDEILPTIDYPPSIRGSLRLILQLKDAFLGSFNLVEEYRGLLLACQHGFTRNLVIYQLTKGLEGINRLRDDLRYIAQQARNRAKKNKWLRDFLMNRYNNPDATDRTGAPLAIAARMGPDTTIDEDTGEPSGNAVPAPVPVPDQVDQALHGGLESFGSCVDVDNFHVPEEIDLATITTASGENLLPVVEFYRRLYFLQMHFQLLMCQTANYAMPVVTQPMTVSDRAFNWPSPPSFMTGTRGRTMRDQLMDIHTDVRALATRLHDCLGVVQQRMHQAQKIEAYFMKQIAAQDAMRRNLLRSIQAQRTYMESLESQNDRLVGLATKLDPDFAKSPEFSMMSGPGYGFMKWPPDSLNSAVPTNRFHPQRSDTNESGDRGPGDRKHDRDGKESYRRFGNHSQSRDSTDGSDKHSNERRRSESNRPHHDYSSERRMGRDSHTHDQYSESSGPNETDYGANDMNISASGGGDPAVWMRHGRSIREKKSDHNLLDRELTLTRQIGELRGQSQIVEELLIGVDSVASGVGKCKVEHENVNTPSIMNTDQYMTSLNEDVFGHGSLSKSFHKSTSSVNAVLQQHMRADSQQVHTPSTKYSQADILRSLSSRRAYETTVDESGTEGIPGDSSVSDRGSEQNIFDDAAKHFRAVGRQVVESASPDFSRGVDSTENTMTGSSHPAKVTHQKHSPADGFERYGTPRELNTNVNASFCKAVTKSHHPLSKVVRTARSTPPDRRISQQSSVTVHTCPPPCRVVDNPEKRNFDKYNPHMLRTADQTHLRQVATVGPAECGGLCVPDWAARRGTTHKVLKVEDLLKEPKRSAFNKAVATHRCRLVESILQADEDRLEEIVSLLLKE